MFSYSNLTLKVQLPLIAHINFLWCHFESSLCRKRHLNAVALQEAFSRFEQKVIVAFRVERQVDINQIDKTFGVFFVQKFQNIELIDKNEFIHVV